MITKQDILDRAVEWQLRPEVVEKDYVLGWLLWGLGRHATVHEHWVFKGGTALKKCYFETYRFSEDLDFSLLPSAPYASDDIHSTLEEVAESVSEASGITIPLDNIIVEPRQDRLKRPTFRARLGYRGPLSFPGAPRRILFDITAHERIVRPAASVSIIHPYPDPLPPPSEVRSYALEELLAEKTRALFERTRPRDLYDVIYILNNLTDHIDLELAQDVFRAKCEAKGHVPPDRDSLLVQVRSNDELSVDWQPMLGHQLPELPPIDAYLDDLADALNWLDDPGTAVAVMPSASTKEAEKPVVSRGIQYWGEPSGLEAIRFAGANRLLARFTYHGRERLVEPYSLRRAETGNVLLYAWEVGSRHIKAFKTAEILDARATSERFSPRYRIEFHASDEAPARPVTRSMSTGPRRSPTSRKRRTRSTTGQTFIIQCPACGREFRRSRNDTTLRKHKTPQGWDCSGRHGYLARIT